MNHKLKIFKEVALTKSFTKAAENLFLSQPAISKTIRNLEQEFGVAFFRRSGNSISLTPEGHDFLKYTNTLLDVYSDLYNHFLNPNKTLPSKIKIGASTTIGQYVAPKITAQIQKKHPELYMVLTCGNTEDIQNLIVNGQLDFAIVEGDNHDTRLHYDPFVKDELVLTLGHQNSICKKDSISVSELDNFSFVEREFGSGTREVIENALKKQGNHKWETVSVLGSTESIKNYLKHSDHAAFLSIHAINQELIDQQLRVVEVEGLSIERWFYFVSRQGFQSKTQQKLQQLFLNHYNQR
ncbi:LysR substrate-binding domain-containing protein [Mariniflexile ostreae]|uniref:LysR substrate-binding domain-containing protein n=1 Tax=Mariniflexile ostreae TaxID=1520892 RepID=A0ABV5FFN8_9FLAO